MLDFNIQTELLQDNVEHDPASKIAASTKKNTIPSNNSNSVKTLRVNNRDAKTNKRKPIRTDNNRRTNNGCGVADKSVQQITGKRFQQ